MKATQAMLGAILGLALLGAAAPAIAGIYGQLGGVAPYTGDTQYAEPHIEPPAANGTTYRYMERVMLHNTTCSCSQDMLRERNMTRSMDCVNATLVDEPLHLYMHEYKHLYNYTRLVNDDCPMLNDQ